jgi:hypothetical protein
MRIAMKKPLTFSSAATSSAMSGSSMTLGEAIQALRASESERDFSGTVPENVAKVLEQHDAIHVLFNCGTSMQDEIAAHVWMLFATTANIREMHRAVASQEHRSVLSKIGHLQLLSVWLKSLPRICQIIFQSLQMNQRLAVEDLAQLREKPIFEIRQSHGIRV